MRKIREAPRDGDDVWRDGWRVGYEQAVRDGQHDHDGPRTWQIEYPPAPPAGTRVRTKDGRVLEVGPDGRVMVGMTSWSWKGVLEDCSPLTEVVETEVDAAARRLREAGAAKANWRLWQDEHGDDIRTVLAHVLNGGQL